MKAVIVEIRGNRAAALLEDGRFVSIPNNAYSIGQEITLLQRKPVRKKHRISFRQRAVAIAASAVLVLSLGGGGLAYAMPYGTVSIDVNPSIEYTINRFDRVLRVSGINEDGQAVLEAIDRNKLLNRRIDDAVTATLSQLEEEGYLSGEEDAIVFSSGTGSEAHSASLAASLEEKFSPQAEIYSVAVSREEIETAHKKGTTAGKMRLFDRLAQDSPENFPEADWIDRPVTEIIIIFRKSHHLLPEMKPFSVWIFREEISLSTLLHSRMIISPRLFRIYLPISIPAESPSEIMKKTIPLLLLSRMETCFRTVNIG